MCEEEEVSRLVERGNITEVHAERYMAKLLEVVEAGGWIVLSSLLEICAWKR